LKETQMSSGYFPLSTYDSDGEKLTLISADLSKLIEGLREAARELDVPEDALSDGTYIGQLDLALELIRRCIRVDAQ
jgi:hypothetical protein